MITQLYEYYMGHVDKLPVEYVLLMVNKGEKSPGWCATTLPA